MSVLKRRIAFQGRHIPPWRTPLEPGTLVPHGQPGLIRTHGDGASYTHLNPLYAADDGAPYPAHVEGAMTDQLYKAGRP